MKLSLILLVLLLYGCSIYKPTYIIYLDRGSEIGKIEVLADTEKRMDARTDLSPTIDIAP